MGEGGGGGRGVCRLHIGSVIVVVFCKKLSQLWQIQLFIRKMNEPVMVMQTTLFTCDYNYRVV